MIERDADVVVLGSGFGGSLLAQILSRIGRSVVVVERGVHPRFAIGESSTPLANLVLADLARRYDLPWLLPLAKYGPWKRSHPELACGLKRGFCYFGHQPGRPFEPTAAHERELAVAASESDETGDTHWYRPDFDLFHVKHFSRTGVAYCEGTEFERLEPDGSKWSLTGRGPAGPVRLTARFLVDATGEAAVLARALGISSWQERLLTRSRALFGHFRGVTPWEAILRSRGARLDDYPFPPDAAAVHHLIDGGWMWVLRFDQGITSAGFALDCDAHPRRPGESPADEWRRLLESYPSLAESFAGAELVAPGGDAAAPPGGLVQTDRMQRFWSRAAGPNWVMLPATCGLVDPLHSTGNAHTLLGIERLARIIEAHWDRSTLGEALAEYEERVRREIACIDRLVHGGYRSLHRFGLFAAYAMCYFAAATTSEDRRKRGRGDDAFLRATDDGLMGVVTDLHQRLLSSAGETDAGCAAYLAYAAEVARALAPYNIAGLCDPARNNMVPFLETGQESA